MFTALVLMAIITTVMTSPLLNRIYPDRMVEHDIAEAERAALGDAIAFRVLVAIDDPAQGRARWSTWPAASPGRSSRPRWC